MFTLTRSGLWAFVGAFLATVLALLWLPYQFPVLPSHSDSYILGFNNGIGILICAAFALCCGISALFLPARQPAPAYLAAPLTPRTLYRALALMLLLTGALYLLFRRLDGFGESLYMIDRLKLFLEGRQPYRQFEFPYGLLMLYVPAALAKLLHLRPADAYGIAWIAAELLGLWMIFKTVRWIDSPWVPKRPIFLFLLTASFFSALSAGLNISILRFILPCFLALAMYGRLAPQSTSRQQAGTILLLAPAFILMLFVSPEFAFAFGLGMTVYLAVFGHMRIAANAAALIGALALCGAATWVDGRLGAFVMAGAFHAGGFNLPIVPAPHILFFLLTLALVSAFAMRQLRAKAPSALLVLVLVSAASCGSALGRCDPTHILFDPFGLTIAALAIAASWARFGTAYRWGAWIVFIALAIPGLKLLMTFILPKAVVPIILAREAGQPESRFDRFILARMTRTLGPQTAEMKFNSLRFAATHSDNLDIDKIYGEPAGTIFNVPFIFTVNHFGTYHDPHLDPGYFHGLEAALTPDLVQRKIDELAQHPDRPLLIQEGDENSCHQDAEGQRGFDRQLLMYPFIPRVRHPDNILDAFCSYIRRSYHVVEPAAAAHYGYAVWKR